MTLRPRTEHVGSLLRPAALLEARHRVAEGKIDAEELRKLEDDAVIYALRQQESIGMGVVGDGEFRRQDFRSGLARSLSGLEEGVHQRSWHGGSGAVVVQGRDWHATGTVVRAAPVATEEAWFLVENASAPFKITLPSPGYVAERFWARGQSSPYASPEELAQEISGILREEINELIALGVPYIQIDNPGYATFIDETARARVSSEGRDPDVAFRAMLTADSALLASIPRESTTAGLHVCRGNNAGAWLHQGGYDRIAEELFGTLPADRILLEFDDARSGGLDVLRFMPQGKVAVLGLISTKVPEVESADALMRRLDEAANFIDPSQLAISPQCGFATHAEGGNPLTEEQQYRKLAVAVEVAQRWFT